MDTNDDFYGKELNLNCFYMHMYQFWTKTPQNGSSELWMKQELANSQSAQFLKVEQILAG